VSVNGVFVVCVITRHLLARGGFVFRRVDDNVMLYSASDSHSSSRQRYRIHVRSVPADDSLFETSQRRKPDNAPSGSCPVVRDIIYGHRVRWYDRRLIAVLCACLFPQNGACNARFDDTFSLVRYSPMFRSVLIASVR